MQPFRLGRALAIALSLVGLLAPGATQSSFAADAPVPLVTDARYFAGVNLPWFTWACDFGCSGTGVGHSATVKAALEEGFGRLKTAGVHAVRWWTFEGGAAQIKRDATGAPTALSPDVYADFDAALALADKYDLAYDFVLFNGPAELPRAWLEDPKGRQQLADTLAPLFERYKDHPRILAWEIFNEPEWDIWSNKIGQDPVVATASLLGKTIHSKSSTAVTVGSATLDALPMWNGQGLDFYSPHWYDHFSPESTCARCTDVPTIRHRYGLDGKPILVGEFYGGPDVDTLQRLRDFQAKGYAGGWAWSLFYDHTDDQMRVDLAAFRAYGSEPHTAPPAPSTTPQPAGPTQPDGQLPAIRLTANWVTPTYLTSGQTITFNQDVATTRDATVAVDFEVYNEAGEQVSQLTLDSQQLSAASTSSFSMTMTLPDSFPAGRYTLKTGVFASDWQTMYAWNDRAGSFVVDSSDSPELSSAQP